MPLDATLERLYARRRFGIRPGPERVSLLLDRLGRPQDSFRTIHVVGTNGKGSTAAFLSAILTAAGHRTGFFSSPHLVRFSERFRIDGREAGHDELSPLLHTVLEQAPDDATFFEIVTALAAFYFSRSRIDIAVMEAGMGGISDATAVLGGLMTVITPVSLDHCDWLGGTTGQIATEKCRIARPGTPVLSARQQPEAAAAVADCCRQGDNPLTCIGGELYGAWGADGRLEYHGISGTLSGLTPGIPGRYQAENASLALAASELLPGCGIAVSAGARRNGIAAARWPGRMEYIDGSPPLLLDGAHNAAGAAALAEALEDYSHSRLLLVTGVMEDKDVRSLLAPLAGRVWRAWAVAPAVERAMPAETLAGHLTALGVHTQACPDLASGLLAARTGARPGDLILVCGSLFTVGEAKAVLAGEAFTGIRG